MITLSPRSDMSRVSPDVLAAADAIRKRGRDAGAELRRLEAEAEQCRTRLREALGPRPEPSLFNPLDWMFRITGN